MITVLKIDVDADIIKTAISKAASTEEVMALSVLFFERRKLDTYSLNTKVTFMF